MWSDRVTDRTELKYMQSAIINTDSLSTGMFIDKWEM